MRRYKNRLDLGLASILTVVCLSASNPSIAAPVTFEFEGIFQYAPVTISAATFAGGSFSGLSPAGTIQGSYTFDDSATDSFPSPDAGIYAGSITSFEVDVSGFQASASSGEIQIFAPPNFLPFYSAVSSTYNGDTVVAPTVDLFGHQLILETIGLQVIGGAAPTNDSLITDPSVFSGSLGGLSPVRATINLGFSSSTLGPLSPVQFILTQLEKTGQVSEPGTVALLATGVVGFVGFFMRRRKITQDD